MPLTPNQRKALFVAKAVEHGLTFERAADQYVDCGWPHLKAGLLGKRDLSEDVKKKTAAFIGLPVGKLFPNERRAAVGV